jgi:hypothetical protein
VQGGVVVQAASCVPNPYASVTPPADGDVQCCLADDSGPACEDRTPSECAVAGGVNLGAGTCTPDPCAGLPPPPGGGTVKVKCERRSGRSKISVDGSNLAAGATPIDAAFIQGTPPQVTGAILTLGGGVVAEATVNCVVR